MSEFVDVEMAKEPGRADFPEMLSFLKRHRVYLYRYILVRQFETGCGV